MLKNRWISLSEKPIIGVLASDAAANLDCGCAMRSKADMRFFTIGWPSKRPWRSDTTGIPREFRRWIKSAMCFLV